MRHKQPRINPSEITPESAFVNRRALLKAAVAAGLVPSAFTAACGAAELPGAGESFANVKAWPGSLKEAPNTWEDITTYNNYYEFGTRKPDPSRNAHTLVTRPWSVTVSGEANRTGTYTIEDILAPHTLEDRIYRLRCVEAWSMVIPWVGFPLADLLARFEPNSRAKFVQFYTLADAEQMPGVRRQVMDFPYREGLTIAEAMHPLTLATVGLYGKVLPNQNGAPLRLVVPWKYGFKSIKSIVRINFTEEKPRITTESSRAGGWTWTTSWNDPQPNEYGFYANVNPEVDHPRWSQATHEKIGARTGLGALVANREPTLMFNGYAEQVAGLYSGLDLAKNY